MTLKCSSGQCGLFKIRTQFLFFSLPGLGLTVCIIKRILAHDKPTDISYVILLAVPQSQHEGTVSRTHACLTATLAVQRER